MKILDEYRNWILSRSVDNGKIFSDGNKIKIETNRAIGEVNFYDLEVLIVEMSVTDVSDGENKFYLHFELKDLEHARELFTEMIETVESLKIRRKTKILLCCTSGLTTNFFKDKLNEAAELLSLDFEFNAVSFSKLYNRAFDYSVVLLAPQIGFQFENVRKILDDKLVLKIPTKTFAGYDAKTLIEFVRTEIDKRKHSAEERAIAKAIGEIKNESKILSIAVMPFSYSTRIAYRIYESGKVIKSETVIKGTLKVIRDIEDILDTISYRCDSFDAVGIAIPGSIHDGFVVLDERMIDPKINFVKLLEEKYHVPIVVNNNLRAAVLGFYSQREKYKNIVFMSQPLGYTIGGQAVIIDGKILTGAHNNAGEVRHIMHTQLERIEYREHLCYDVEKILQSLSIEILAAISVVDPELICIRSEMTPDIEQIRETLARYIPEEFLPEMVFVKESEMTELVLLGQMILCLETLDGKTM